MVATPDSSRVPAWKKLGLKLKHANDESPAAHSPSSSKKRVRDEEGAGKSELNDQSTGAPSKKSKKRKTAPAEEPTSPSDEPSKKEKKEKKKKSKETVLATPVKSLQRKKSVSFTPDTKKSDGDSGQQLFRAWVKSQDGSSTEDGIVPSTESAVEDSPADESKPEPSKKDLKKAKKDQRNAARAAEAAQQEKQALPYVSYLQQYHSDRSNWKFNKKHQVDLLKNLFNLFRVPASYDPAVEAYIAGLKGAGARYRLKEQAEGILKEASNESKDDPAKRHRAEEVLKALGHVDEPPAVVSKTIQPPKEAEAPEDSNKKRARPRKSRTVDVSSSSEDDSSSDESSVVSSSSEEPSSDSDSSSSSDSDSDSDADSDSDSDSDSSSSDDSDSGPQTQARKKSKKDDSSDTSDTSSDSD
ncbi:putative proteasome subunit alpha type 6 protein [Lasiodiplodia theobromae]|uniref:Proteasome subunit alpha type 6 n=1 Tax=Lasiodiplodia theobromae TaxID=45133 RepID=UPI0015C3F0CB|nr:Proteasome subunit alpha type 6 [Lasiodiplodia theobromae]KAF4535528.1 Proteasome subunit alpha type 6 [Lasiodiplodia theobromae]KAF9638806.1 putative proteasome subunit alpha type 6 protein [Lasiodiplodia theobromae]